MYSFLCFADCHVPEIWKNLILSKTSCLTFFVPRPNGRSVSSIYTGPGRSGPEDPANRVIDIKDPSVLPDLRALNSGQASRYDTFWEECAKFISEEVGSALDGRRHGQITHSACAILVRDLVAQVKSRCPPDTATSSAELVTLQFWPKPPAA